MATLAMNWYGHGVEAVFDNTVDMVSDDIRVALMESTYSPDQGADENFADISADEASGTGYTAGGEALTNRTLVYSSSDQATTFDADDVTWSNSSISAQYAVIYDATSDRLLAYGDAGSTQESVDADFTITWDSNGILQLTAA